MTFLRIPFRSCVLIVLVLSTPLSFAALGGNVSSVSADRIQLRGTLQSSQTGSFAIHEIQLPTGTVVREYMSPSGVVFAVTWRGPWLPNLQQLMGTYFQRYADALQAETSAHPGRAPIRIVQSDFVMKTTGHLRSFAGRVYLPAITPAGVNVEALP